MTRAVFARLLLPLGPYKVTAKATNFGTLVRQGLDLAVGQTISLTLTLNISQVEAGGLGLGRGADSGIRPRREFHVSRPAARARSAEQRPQLSEPGAAHAGRVDRAGSGRRRDFDQRSERNQQQRFDRRRGQQQSLLRRTARRPAAGVHRQPGRDQGVPGGVRQRAGGVRPQFRRLHQCGDQVRHQQLRMARCTNIRSGPA